MCRIVVTTYACGHPGPKPYQVRECVGTQEATTHLRPEPRLRSRQASICMLDSNKGAITEQLDGVCEVCSQGVNPGDLIIWPKKETGEKASEKKGPSDLGGLSEKTRLAEEASVAEGQQLSEEQRRAQEAIEDGRAKDPSGEGGPTDTDELTIAPGDLETTMLPRASEDTRWFVDRWMTPDGMAEAEEELAEEERSSPGEWSMTQDGMVETEEELAEEERGCSEAWSMTPDGMAEAEEELAEEGRNVSEDWSLTPDGMEEAEDELANTEKSWSIDWSVTSTELAEAKKEEEEWMAEEDREIAEEERILLAMADDDYNITLRTYDQILQGYCNDLLHVTVCKEQQWTQGSLSISTSGPVRKENAMVAGIGNTDARDKKAVESPADGDSAGVPHVAPGGNDKPLPMAGVLEADRRGAMDTETVTIPAKLVPQTDYDKVLSGMEDVAFIEEVADACTEDAEQWTEGGKIYLAVKAAMGDEWVGTYQFVAGQVGLIITNFIISVVGAALRPLQKEQKEIREDKKLERTQAWIIESGAALETVWPGDVLGPPVWPEDAWAPTDGGLQADDFGGLNDDQTPLPTLGTPDASQPSSRGRGTGRARGIGRARRSGRAGGNTGRCPQITDSAAAESVAGGFAEDSKNAETTILPTLSKPLEPGASDNGGSEEKRARPRGSRDKRKRRGRGYMAAGTSTLRRPVDQSLMHDGPQLGKMNKLIALEAMGSHSPTTAGAGGGVAEAPISPPVLDKSQMHDGSQLGIKNRKSATEGTGGGSTKTPILPPTVDKPPMPDTSQLGKRKRENSSETTRSHLQTIEGAAEGSAKTRRIFPPTIDKSLLPDASKLGKRKRGSASETIGGHLQTIEGAAKGAAEDSNDAETPLQSSFSTDFQSDASQVSTRGRASGRERRRRRGSKRSREN
ncbi:hypothetical protein VE00_06969 [Pseudogymnoascus sp. WSF 3629]|nr:hypothetical protein VE00_06969 [Pseudogymnoascus sp. WSF 3629]